MGEETPEEKAAREEEEKKAAEAEAKKKAEEIAECKRVLTEAGLVLTKSAAMNPPAATLMERIDYLRDTGMPDASLKEAMKECGVEEPTYKRDYWGRIIAVNDVKYNPNSSPPPADAFGQLRDAE